MTPRSLFMIVLKCLGVIFIKEFLLIIPQFLSVFLYLTKEDTITIGLWTLFSSIFLLAVYFLVFYYLIFKTEIVIQKLQLERGFDEDKFTFNIHRASVLSIVIIVAGLLIVVDAFPTLCRQLFFYFQEKRMTYGQTNPGIGNVVVSAVQIIIGLLLIGNQRQLVNFIERKRRNTVIQDEQI